MSVNLQELLNRMSGKCELLARRYSLVKQQRDEALELCEERQTEINSLKAKLQEALTEIEYLRISHKIAATPEDARQAQEMISVLIKKIDKCITRLNND